MRYLTVCVAVLFIPALTLSDTIYVPDDYATIQGAIDAAVNGDMVIVKPGTYVENIDFKGKSITVQSSEGPAITVIDGNQAGSVVLLQNGEGLYSVLEGFTITNGTGAPHGTEIRGGGIYCTNASPSIRNNCITGNYQGGVLVGSKSTVTFEENVVNLNSCVGNGGGFYCTESSILTLEGNEFLKNTASESGGGVYITDSASVIIRNNIFAENYTDEDGGALYCMGQADVTITDNTFLNNTADNHSSGIYLNNVTGIIENNLLDGGYDQGFGDDCGIYVVNSPMLITRNTITNFQREGIECGGPDLVISYNTITHNNRGGILCGSSVSILYNTITDNDNNWPGGGIDILGDTLVVGNLISGNSTGMTGGGIDVYRYSDPMIVGNIIMDNFAYGNADGNGGGGLNCVRSSSIVTSNLFYRNSTHRCGGGICSSLSTPHIVNNTFVENQADEYGGAIACAIMSDAQVANCILWDNDAQKGQEIWVDLWSSTLTILYSNVRGYQDFVFVESGSTLNWGPGMINEEPLFVDRAQNDFHLTFNSPCRNSGINSVPNLPTHDFENDPRIAYGTVDMGADEFYTHLYYTGDATPMGDIQGKIVGLPTIWPVGLFLSAALLDPPLQHMWGLFHLQPPFITIPLIPIPSNGILVLPATIPATPPAPYDVFMQALVGGELSNLSILEVR